MRSELRQVESVIARQAENVSGPGRLSWRRLIGVVIVGLECAAISAVALAAALFVGATPPAGAASLQVNCTMDPNTDAVTVSSTAATSSGTPMHLYPVSGVLYADASTSQVTSSSDMCAATPNLGGGVTSGNSYTSLTLSTAVTLPIGADVILGFGTGSAQTVTLSAASTSSTTVTVTSFVASSTFNSGSEVVIPASTSVVGSISVGTSSSSAQTLSLDLSGGSPGPSGEPCQIPISVNLGSSGGANNAISIISTPGTGVTAGSNGISLATNVVGACTTPDLTYSNVAKFSVTDSGVVSDGTLAGGLTQGTVYTSITLSSPVTLVAGSVLDIGYGGSKFQPVTVASDVVDSPTIPIVAYASTSGGVLADATYSVGASVVTESVFSAAGDSVTGSAFPSSMTMSGNSGGADDFMVASTVQDTVNGGGATATLDLSNLPALTSVNVNTGHISIPNGGGSVTDSTSQVQEVLGSGSGTTTFVAPASGGCLFVGEGTGNVLDLSAAGTTTTVTTTTSGIDTVAFTAGADTFVDVPEILGSTSSATDFVAGATGGYDFVGQGNASGNVLNLSGLTGSLTVDVTGAGTETASGGAISGVGDTFSGIDNVDGTSGATTFVAGSTGGYKFAASSAANVLQLTSANSGVLVDMSGATCPVSSEGCIENLTSGEDILTGTFASVITPTAGSATVKAPTTGGITFTGKGSASTNTLDLSAAPASTTVTLGATTTVQTAVTYDPASIEVTIPVLEWFENPAGGVYWDVDSNEYVNCTGATGSYGSSGSLTGCFASDVNGSPISGTTSIGFEDLLYGPSELYTDAALTVPSIEFEVPVASTAGFVLPATFVVGSASFTCGSTTTISGAPAFATCTTPGNVSITINAGASIVANPQVLGLSGGADNFSGFANLIGSSSGSTHFVSFVTGGFTFTGQGLDNQLDVTELNTGLTIDVTSSIGTITGITSGGNDTFTQITTLITPGSTTFKAGDTGGFTFTAGGTPSSNTLDMSATTVPITVNVSGSVTGLSLGSDSFSGISVFVGSSSGGTSFVAGSSGGYSFTGKGSTANTLNLSSANSGITVNTSGSVTGLSTGTDTFSGITVLVGPTAGSATFVTGSTGGFTFTGGGATNNNTLDLSTANSGITVDLTGTATCLGLTGDCATGLTSGVSDAFSGIGTVKGSSSGSTTFKIPAAGGYVVVGQGSANTNEIDLSSAQAGVTVNVVGSGCPVTATNCVSGLQTGVGTNPTTDTFTGVTTFVGSSSGSTTFSAGTAGGYTFTGKGSSNTLDLTNSNAGVTVNASNAIGSVSGLTSGGTDSFSGITILDGSNSGSTTFKGGSTGGYSFVGAGNSNVLDLSNANTGVVVDVTGTGACSGSASDCVTGLTSATPDSFSAITTIVGAVPGLTTFRAGATGGFTFTGQGSGNVLDLSNSSVGATVDLTLPTPTVSGLTGSPSVDYFTGITSIDGSNSGSTVFKVGGAGGYTFTGGGTGNTLNLTTASAGITISTHTGTVSGLTSGGNDTFTDITTFIGSASGSTTFATSSGGFVFTAQGTASTNVLNLSGAQSGVTVDLTLSTPTVTGLSGGSGSDTFSGIATFVGATGGGTTFKAATAGGFSFTGQGASNVLDLSGAGSGVTFNLTGGTPSVTGLSGGNDVFVDIQSFTGSSAGGNTFVSSSSGGFTFSSQGSSNTVNLSAAGTGAIVAVGSAATSATSAVTVPTSGTVTIFVGSTAGMVAGLFEVGGASSPNVACTGIVGGGTPSLTGCSAIGSAVSVSNGTSVSQAAQVGGLSGGSDQLIGISAVVGSSSGVTTFEVRNTSGSLLSLTGQGTGNVLDFSGVTGGGVNVNLVLGQATPPSGGAITFADIQTFNGSPGNDKFVVGSGNATFNGGGGSDTLDFSSVSSGVTVNLNTNPAQVTLGGQGTVTFSGITVFVGSTQGNNDFLASSSGGYTFTGQGSASTNTVNLAAAGTGVSVDVTGSGSCPVSNTNCVKGLASGVGGSTTDNFSGATSIVGSSSGSITFVAGSAGAFSFTGQGSGNTLNLSSATAGVTFNVTGSSPTVSGLTGGNDAFSDIQNLIGSASAGGNTFVAPAQGGFTFTAGGTGNSLNLASANAGITVNVTSSSGSVTGLTSGGADTFIGLTTIIGSSSGSTTFVAGATGGYTFEGGGTTSTNLLDLSSGASGLNVDVTDTVECLNNVVSDCLLSSGSALDAFSGIGRFKGANAGSTTFTAGPIGGLTFAGQGTGNILDLTAANSGLVVDLTASTPTVSGLSSGGNDSFTDVKTIDGSAAGSTTFKALSSGGYTFTGNGIASTNLLDLSAASTGVVVDVTDTVACPTVTSDCVTGLSGGSPDAFSGIGQIKGASVGGTTLRLGSAGGFTFTAQGTASTNSLDLSAANAGLLVDVTTSTATISGLASGGNDTATGVLNFTGSSAGSTTFRVGGTGGYVLTGQGTVSTNHLDLSAAGAGLTVLATGSTPTITGLASGSNDTFTGITSVTGSLAGSTIFRSGSVGGWTFTGQGTASTNELDLSAAAPPGAMLVDVSGTACSGQCVTGFSSGGNDTMSGIAIVVGPTTGHTTFRAGSAGGYAFTGQGSGNVLDVSPAVSGVTVNFTAATPIVTVSAGASDTFLGITTVIGASAGHNTVILGSTGGYTFTSQGGGNAVNLSSAGTGVTITAGTGTTTATAPVTVPWGPGAGVTINVVSTVGFTSPGVVIVDGSAVVCTGMTATSLTGCTSESTSGASILTGDTLVADAVISGLSSGSDSVGGVTSFLGSASGGTTFKGGATGGYTFTGQGSGNTLDFSLIPAGPSGTVGVIVNLVNGQVSMPGGGSPDGFSDIAFFVGSPNNDDFQFGSGTASVNGDGGTDTADFSAVSTGVLINASTSTIIVTAAGVAESLTGITKLTGSSAGGNTFKAGNTSGLTFTGGGFTGNTLDLSGVTSSSSGAVFCLVVLSGPCATANTVILPGGSADTFSNIQSFVGTAYADRFVMGQGTFTLVGNGGADIIDFSSVGTSVAVNVSGSSGTASGGNVSDMFSGITTVVGPTGGGSTFKAGATGGYTFTGQGSGNTLDFSSLGSSAGGVLFNLGTGVATPSGSTSDSFTGIQDINGSAGNDTFKMAAGTYSLVGGGGTDTLDISAAPSGTTVNLAGATGTVTGTGWSDSVVGVVSTTGSTSGGTTFVAGPTGGYTFTGQGSGNVLDLSAAPVGVSVVDTGIPGQVTNLSGGGTDTFTSITTFLGSTSGGTTFVAPVSGGVTFVGQGQAQSDTLNLSALPAGITVFAGEATTATAGATVPVGPGTGVTISVVSTSGFDVPSSLRVGGVLVTCTGATATTFTGCTTSNTNPVAITSGEAIAGVTAISGLPSNDSISGIAGFTGSSGGGTTFVVGPIGGFAFNGLGTGNTLSLANVAAGPPGSPGATIDAHGGQITLAGSGGTDIATGIQTYIGTPNNDTFVAGAGNISFVGGGGNDTVSFRYAPSAVTVDLSTGTVTGGWGGNDSLSGVQNVVGSAFADTIEGDLLPSVFTGGGGNTTFVLIGGTTIVNGGSGNTTIDLSQTQFACTIDLNDPSFQDTGGAGTLLLVPGTVRNVIGSPFGTQVLGGLGSGTLTGSSGSDLLEAGAGNTTIDAGSGNETLIAGSGTDTLNGGSGTDMYVPGSGTVTINGGSGSGTLDYAGAPSAVDVNLSSTSFVLNLPGTTYTGNTVIAGHSASGGWGGRVTISGVENVIGTNHNDIIVGDANANTITDGTGTDLIVGGGGGDNLTGGGGPDTFMSGAGDNLMTCGGGNCTIDYSNAPSGVVVNLAQDSASNGFGGQDTIVGFENIVGSKFDDTLTLGPPGGFIRSLGGNDTLTGSVRGFDTLVGGSGDDTFIAGAGGHDNITGGSGDNTIFAQNGEPDYINGGVGGFNEAEVDSFDTVVNVQQFF